MLNSTPKYLGAGQPSAQTDGPSAWLDSLFGIFGGGGTPSYAGKGQPAPSSGRASSTPAYQAPPAAPPSTPATPDEMAVPEPCTLPDPFGGGGYAIVVPRCE